jgi:hypothetical protein
MAFLSAEGAMNAIRLLGQALWWTFAGVSVDLCPPRLLLGNSLAELR